jgi:hypothetical protein
MEGNVGVEKVTSWAKRSSNSQLMPINIPNALVLHLELATPNIKTGHRGGKRYNTTTTPTK